MRAPAAPAATAQADATIDAGERLSRSPTAALLVVGVACGPEGLGLLSPSALLALDPAVPVALAILGVLAGVSLPVLRAATTRVVTAATLEAAVAMACVGGTMVLAWRLDLLPAMGSVAAFCTVCAVAASSSLLLPRADRSSRGALHVVIEAGVLVPIVLGGVALAVFREASAPRAILLMTQAIGAVLLLAVAAWLLVGSATTEVERRLFTIAAVMVVGGAADFLSLSALLGGFVAGAAWHALGGPARDALRADAHYVRQPFLAMVLVLAGANAHLSAEAIALAGLYAFSRAAAKLIGARLASRVAQNMPAGVGRRLLSPGVFGVAFALNAHRAAGLALALDVVVLGTIVADAVAGIVRRERTGA